MAHRFVGGGAEEEGARRRAVKKRPAILVGTLCLCMTLVFGAYWHSKRERGTDGRLATPNRETISGVRQEDGAIIPAKRVAYRHVQAVVWLEAGPLVALERNRPVSEKNFKSLIVVVWRPAGLLSLQTPRFLATARRILQSNLA